jgi:hypothetical protein
LPLSRRSAIHATPVSTIRTSVRGSSARKAATNGGSNVAAIAWGCRDANRVDRATRDIRRRDGCNRELTLGAEGGWQKFTAVGRKCDFAGGPLEKGEANTLLKLAYQVADSRRCEIESAGGEREIAKLRRRDEGGKLACRETRYAHAILRRT